MTGLRLYRLALGLGVALLGVLFVGYGYENTWQLWNIPTMSPCFADLRTITHGVRSRAMGYDPLVENPADPWDRPMNYPRVWQLLWWLGIDERHTVYLGVAFALLFFAALYLFPPRTLPPVAAVLLLLVVFSPAVLLGVERGNSDLLVFFLLTVTLVLLRKRSVLASVGALFSALLAFILKLFPLFGLTVLMRERKSAFFRLSLLVLAVAVMYLVVIHDDLVLIRRGTPKGTQLSYGVNVLWMRIAKSDVSLAAGLRVLAYAGVCTAGIMAALGLFSQGDGSVAQGVEAQARLDAFRIGSGIYLGTFLLGNNWDYRLVFLLFTVVQLEFWAKSRSRVPSVVARVVIVSMLVSVWHLMIRRVLNPCLGELPGFLLDECANWLIFLGLAYLIAYSAPTWMKDIALGWCDRRWLQS